MDLLVLWIVVFLALSFDFINGFHDTANAIATAVSTRALKPRVAIIMAATMNFLGAVTFTGVAATIGKGVANPAALSNGVAIVIAALISAIAWNLITWWFGIPSSSSHALIGSLAGAVIGGAGISNINSEGLIKIVKALLLSPVLAFAAGFIIMWILKQIFAKSSPHQVNKGFRFAQILTAAFQSFSHGTNDAQKAMGIIVFALVASDIQTTMDVPMWVKISAATSMALGTSVGGWKIIKTMGTKIFKIEPINGFAADAGSAIVILTATMLHLPVSTTHVITSSILGVGSAKRFSAVKWGVAGRIGIAWVITIPITVLMAMFTYWIVQFFF
ncbi:PiT family inorganic phosphate transporter [Paenibacillus castaneae]|uniref:inorganic phosphate transporter n=1 Tax=Paenibacillus castaneae TaxID=474957 RepID=UPI000C9CF854|nr:inorganic phosphate transporter [Paenibacillus castaneae]NIK77992.1 PiT family inorganic phosphate transporter [Paenibacillus castaneae]